MDISIVLGALIAVGCACFALGFLSARVRSGGAVSARELALVRQQLEEAQRDAGVVRAQLAAAQARSDRLEEENNGLIARAKTDNDILRSLAPITQQLEVMEQRVRDVQVLQGEQRTEIRTQLSAAARTQEDLARATQALRGALSSTSARGMWGEVELRRVVEAAGMLPHVDFSEQVSAPAGGGRAAGARPDMVIHLPGGAHLPLDAKVPLTAMLQAQAAPATTAEEIARRQDLRKQHAKAVRAHVNALAKRDYPALFPGSPRITIMFLPGESLLAEALREDPPLLEDALNLGVVPASPASLLALLRTVATLWASSKVSEEAGHIIALGREMTDRLRVVAGHLEKLGNSLTSAVKNYNSALSSFDTRVLVTARRLESLDADFATPPAIAAEEGQVKRFHDAALREALDGEEDHETRIVP
ncbi:MULTISPECIES: DNA recombination protein RmuC [Actinotignum]|uniref:DNA recombination protein RmuC n=1 Tax=Actinotignum timonense TaxID=1870995 RepID=A0AAW9HBY4_9ACTO|nr:MULTISPECIES: DNA recombination protein RmuC [Actinotignum]MDE1559084.1 DNA recombination protein RmuC [Actinotignum schaalii]MDE1664053.1 DNA recombination protein RmuC [Actinotignum schaalii]MDK6373827.1 DNA recombination protein RmuC [Actinotignum timonense]MDK6419281.1 DNA recombination protein RmuC [Actinotignum timonense]MDK6589808.1 DNA recombination protein RmuC [Actinotignum timonense]